jgi:hypothetical protein
MLKAVGNPILHYVPPLTGGNNPGEISARSQVVWPPEAGPALKEISSGKFVHLDL